MRIVFGVLKGAGDRQRDQVVFLRDEFALLQHDVLGEMEFKHGLVKDSFAKLAISIRV